MSVHESMSAEEERYGRALDPARDPLGWNLAVERILDGSDTELSRRRSGGLLMLGQWASPVLTAAASVILLACGGLFWAERGPFGDDVDGSEAAARVLEETLYPPVVAQWLGGELEPTVEELVFASLAD